MLLGADRTRNNGILIYLFKVTKIPKNNTPWKIGRRRRGYNATDELISY